MVDETLSDNVSQSNGELNKGITQDFPGGKQNKLPNEPQLSEASTASKMGCTNSNPDETASSSTEEKPKAKNGQQKIDSFYLPVEKKGDSTGKNNNNLSPKRSNISDEDEPSKRAKSKASVENVSDDGKSENKANQRQSGPVTRSSNFSSKIRETFPDSDDDDDDNNSRYQSWAKRDISDYRNNYPYARSDSKINDNYKFYTNKIPSHPDGDFIDNIHKEWFGQYGHLEYHHGYIQWLFPLQEKGLNWSAEPLQKHEIELIKNDPKALKRILTSYKLMLDFYGFELADEKTGELRRRGNGAYKERFRNLNTSSHNYLRITRILKCLGEFDYEYLKFSFLEAILRECITENTLGNCLRSCKDYWIETLRVPEERRAIRRYAKELIEYRDKGISPPKSHRAERPTATSATTKKIENMRISKNKDN